MKKIVIAIAILVIGVAGLLFSRKRMSVQPQNTNTIPSSSVSQSVSPSTAMPASQNTVTLMSSGFTPASMTVKAGDTVTWINKSGAQATVNSNPHPSHTDYPPLNLGAFTDGQSLSLKFDKPGTYGYHNHLNPSQSGTIIVQ